MIDFLYSIDVAVFFFINRTLSNAVLDVLMPFLTNLNSFKPILVLVAMGWIWLMIKGGKRGRTMGILLVVTIAFSDQFSSSVLKHLVGRIRPCHILEGVRLLTDCGSGYSFPSSHAVNNFAGAMVIVYFYRKLFCWCFGFASLIALTRPYVGVHYPSDIIGGALIGLGCGYCIIVLWKGIDKLYQNMKQKFLHQ